MYFRRSNDNDEANKCIVALLREPAPQGYYYSVDESEDPVDPSCPNPESGSDGIPKIQFITAHVWDINENPFVIRAKVDDLLEVWGEGTYTFELTTDNNYIGAQDLVHPPTG